MAHEYFSRVENWIVRCFRWWGRTSEEREKVHSEMKIFPRRRWAGVSRALALFAAMRAERSGNPTARDHAFLVFSLCLARHSSPSPFTKFKSKELYSHCVGGLIYREQYVTIKECLGESEWNELIKYATKCDREWVMNGQYAERNARAAEFLSLSRVPSVIIFSGSARDRFGDRIERWISLDGAEKSCKIVVAEKDYLLSALAAKFALRSLRSSRGPGSGAMQRRTRHRIITSAAYKSPMCVDMSKQIVNSRSFNIFSSFSLFCPLVRSLGRSSAAFVCSAICGD